MTYFRSEQWYKDAAEAKEKFKVVRSEGWPEDGVRENRHVRFVEAEAGTGSRYVVVATPLGPIGQGSCGGPVLVTVLWPWQDCWALQPDGTLHESYVAEHLTDGRYREGRLHGGDLMALTMTVAHALGREAVQD